MDDPSKCTLPTSTRSRPAWWNPGISVLAVNPSEPSLPVGMQILAKHFDEANLLRVADAYEKAGGFK